jgi:DNA-binding NtrC family response regulator
MNTKKKNTILIFDMKLVLAQELANILENHTDYEVIIDEDDTLDDIIKYEEVIKQADNIVLLVGPDTNILGTENILEKVSEIQKMNKNTRGILCSDINDPSFIAEVVKEGAFDYIMLPFDFEEVVQKVKEAFDTPETQTKVKVNRRSIVSKTIKEIFDIVKLTRKNLGADHVLIKNVIARGRAESFLYFQTYENMGQLQNILEKAAGLKIKKEKKPTVLSIEDEAPLRDIVDGFLEDDYTMLFAEDGKTALEQLKKQPHISIVLLDIVLPDILGIDLLPKIKEINKEALVIVLTAYKDIEYAITTMRNGAYCFLNKPFTQETLLYNVKEAEHMYYYHKIFPLLIQELKKKLL